MWRQLGSTTSSDGDSLTSAGLSPQRNKRGSLRVFESDILEEFTHVHPGVPLLVWGPVVLGLLYRSLFVLGLGIPSVLGIGIFALTCWTLLEYLLHRSIFHFPQDTPLRKRVHFLIHGLHHDDPNDATRLVMPPFASVVLSIIHFAFFRFLFGPIWVEPFFAFFLVGYLVYDYTHYAIHHFHQRTALGRLIKRHHMQHHFVTKDAKFGVSSPIWDYVFGTLESPGRSARENVLPSSTRSTTTR